MIKCHFNWNHRQGNTSKRCSADCSRQALLAAEQQPQLGAERKHLGERSEVGERGRRTGCCTLAATGCSREDSSSKIEGC